MKIEKIGGTHLLLKSEADNVLNIIPVASYVAYHTTKDSSIVISNISTNQSLKDSIIVESENITLVDGVAFSGTRVELMNQLATLMSGCCSDAVAAVPAGIAVDYITITKLDEINFKLEVAVSGDTGNEVVKITPTITDLGASNAPTPSSFDMTSFTDVEGVKIFEYNTLTFADTNTVIGETYQVTGDLVNVSNEPLLSMDDNIVVQGIQA